jgi:hypothetical protein
MDSQQHHDINKFAQLNITDKPFRAFQKNDPTSANGPGKRFVQFEEYGWSANLGLRWKL